MTDEEKLAEKMIEDTAGKIKQETEGGYLENWRESKILLSPEQQKDYFRTLARQILGGLEGVYVAVEGTEKEWVCDAEGRKSFETVIKYIPLAEIIKEVE